MELACIICGRVSKHPRYRVVERIKNYHVLSDTTGYVCKNPVIYEEYSGRNFTADLSDIVYADFSQAVANIGDAYKIPNEYIEPVMEG